MIVSELCIYPIKSCQGIQLKTAEVTAKGFLWDREMMLISQRGKFLTQRQFPQLARVQVQLVDDSLTLSMSDNSLEPLTFTPILRGEEIEVEIWRDRTIGIDQGDLVAQWFHQVLELDNTKKCRLVRQSPQYKRKVQHRLSGNHENTVSFADGYPCLLTTTASLAELNRRIMDTYQDSSEIVSMDRFRSNIVVETEIPFDEDNWKRIQIGELVFAVVKPCSRCIIPTVNQQNGDRNKLKEPLRTLGTFRQFGEQGVMFGENMIPLHPGTISVGDRLQILTVR
ncbi:putative Fe-S protein [Hyella patelloides LEGE 07179]|uniref:Putative Fe-S protein n=1 Tax=Hyella patelloides LEGE 07179 TaxID=945734 RepID=A0A563VVN7_9CYAN|nr:MOSC N-terminal beta barrel domain-containing protein [Hyella patelloides]VEP15476.1 putative Fe-S protein [Hyella patelloides LEGE 07179]